MGASSNASSEATKLENQRQTTIADNVKDINAAFNNRGQQYSNFTTARQQQYSNELAKQQKEAARTSKFALARGGLTGGSASVDAGKKLADELNTGTLNAQAKVSGELASLKQADENSRQAMIALAQNGASIGNAADQTSTALLANNEAAKAASVPDALGSVFGASADMYKNMQEQAAIRRGLRYSSLYKETT